MSEKWIIKVNFLLSFLLLTVSLGLISTSILATLRHLPSLLEVTTCTLAGCVES